MKALKWVPVNIATAPVLTILKAAERGTPVAGEIEVAAFLVMVMGGGADRRGLCRILAVLLSLAAKAPQLFVSARRSSLMCDVRASAGCVINS
jgi:hypothetical protein